MEENKTINFLTNGLTVIFLLFVGAVLYYGFTADTIVYEMSNGVICNNKQTVGASRMGNKGLEFIDCSDGLNYLNPETYKTIKIESKQREK